MTRDPVREVQRARRKRVIQAVWSIFASNPTRDAPVRRSQCHRMDRVVGCSVDRLPWCLQPHQSEVRLSSIFSKQRLQLIRGWWTS